MPHQPSREYRAGRAGIGLSPSLPRLALLALILTSASSTSRAQADGRSGAKFYPDSSDTAEALLRNAAGHARDGQWSEAVELYQRVIQQFGDKVARLPKDDPSGDPTGESTLYVDLRQFCQRRLAALPPEARALYRGRVDAQAERWYRQGVESGDRASLRRVVDLAFCSSWGDDALESLGDLAFQEGRFGEALAAYRQLVPERPDAVPGLVHPDPSVDLARVAAKTLLCRAALGDDPPTNADIEAFARAYPGAGGALAGRKGPYEKTLAEALRSDGLAPPELADGRWPTFAGAPTRTRVVPESIDVGSLQWRVALKGVRPQPTRSGFRVPVVPVPPDRLLGYHPIVLGDQVIVCDDERIVAYDLNKRPEGPVGSPSGEVREAWRHDERPGTQVARVYRMPVAPPRYTLTAFGDRIYARMGPSGAPPMGAMGMGMGRAPASPRSYLVAVDRSTDGKLLWRRPADSIPLPKRPAQAMSQSVGFEGTPVADARNVYVALTDRLEQTATYVACLDAETGDPRWVRHLGEAASDVEINNMMMMGGAMMGPPGDFGHRLLTLDGPSVYFQTNLGAVAALDAETGGIRWIATYPRRDRGGLGGGAKRDLNPAIVHDGLVIVAPDDAASIYAFDAGTGRLAWKTDPLPDEVGLAHLLGVARGNLVATGDRVLLFDVKTGKLAHTWPDGGRAFEGFGRGVLSGDRIYWPTRTEIHVLDQATGLRTEPPIRLQERFQTTGGNLVVGDGYLIVAQAEALVVFCQNSRLIKRYTDEIAQAPDQASGYYRLAQAAEATGRDELALDALERGTRVARPSERIDGVGLLDAMRDHRFRLLMKLGAKARAAKDWDPASARFVAAAGAARSDRDRLSARLLLSEVQLERGSARDAVATLQGVLSDGRLRLLNIAADDGRRTVRADLLVADRLGAILRGHGRSLYDDYDREASALRDRGVAEGAPRLLEEVVRSYPVALAVPDALLALGRLHEAQGRPADAAHAYKRLLAAAPEHARRARALWGLANAYEAQRLWVPARDAYSQVLSRFPGVRPEEADSGPTLGALAAERLAREPFESGVGDLSEPDLALPLVRRWARTSPGPSRPLGADGIPPSPEASRVFLARGPTLRPIDPATGLAPWTADVGGEPIWAGYLDDKLIVATEGRIVALRHDGGTIDWRNDLSAPDPSGRRPDPFAGGATPPDPSAPSSGRLHDFQIVGGRVFCQAGDRELMAIDGATGLVDWSFSPPEGGVLNPLLWVGPRRIALQVRKPNAIVVLETAGGRRVAEYPQAEGDEPWMRAPLPIDDDRVALVTDTRTVALFDLVRGANAWVFRESPTLPTSSKAPRLLGDAERLLVIQDGSELIRLDVATGAKLWARPLGFEVLSERPEATAIDAGRFYWASGRALCALSLADGELAWKRHLTGPESGWSIALTSRCVAAFPGTSAPAPDAAPGFPLVFRSRDTGALVQRLLLPSDASETAVRIAHRSVTVAARGDLWSYGDRRAMDAPAPAR